MMYYADHHGFPIVTFIDTPGAYADLKSEEKGQVHEMSFFFYVLRCIGLSPAQHLMLLCIIG